MKVLPISPKEQMYRKISVNNKENQNTSRFNQINKLNMSYPKEFYVNFTGGKSLDLSQTIEQLNKYNVLMPDRVQTLANKTLEAGNPENKKLVDIHKEAYKELFDCDSLEEIRFFFPEFKDVKSVEELDSKPQNNSLIDKFQKGEIVTNEGKQLLNPEKDLTMQLIQMYWGDCLSLSDIKNATGFNFASVMNKLNIPKNNQIYGQYLKLSDEEANKAITEAMQRNRTIPEKTLKKEGKPLSKETREKISNSLKKYYETHEHIQFYQSEEDEEYFLENPYQSEIFSEVLLRAWKYQEARSIKKALSKHLKKPENEINSDLIKNAKQSKILRTFWDKNPWAKKQWSTCMSKSWERQRALKEIGLIYEPKALFPAFHKLSYTDMERCYIVRIDDKAISLKEMYYVVVPSENEPAENVQTQGKYFNRLISLAFNSSNVIINKNLYGIILKLPKVLNWALADALEINKNSGENEYKYAKIVGTLKKIKGIINTALTKDCEKEMDEKKLPILTAMYCDIITECINSDNKDIMTLLNDIYNLLCGNKFDKYKFRKIEEKFISNIFDRTNFVFTGQEN